MIDKLVLLFACLVLSACVTDSTQHVRMPSESVRLEDATATRVYFVRRPQPYGRGLAVRVYEGERLVGRISQERYLCWEGPSGRRTVTGVLERRRIDGGDVESFLDVPGEPGAVYYCAAECEGGNYGKLKLALVSERDGRDLVEHCKPAEVGE